MEMQDSIPPSNNLGIKDVKSEGSRSLQYRAGISACILMVSWGEHSCWTSPAIPHLTSGSSPFPVTDEQGVWIVSLYNLGDLFGGLLNPLFIDRIGRKRTLLLSALPGLFGWLLIIFAENYRHLYLARFIAGIGQGSTYNSLVIYLTEISEKNVRGILVNMIQTSTFLGIFIFTSTAAFSSYNFLNLTSASLVILFLLIFPFSPETPYYYLMRGREKDAIDCLMKLRGLDAPDELESEIREMSLAIEEEKKLETSGFRELISKRYNRRGLMIIFCLKLVQLMSGITPISSYAEEILSYSSLPIDAGVQVMIFNGIGLLASLGTNTVIDRCNRRILFLSTGLAASVCLASVGLFFFMDHYLEADVSSIMWVPFVAITSFQVIFLMGYGTIPYIIQGELFPMNVKGSAVSCGMVIGSTFTFLTASGYKFLSNATGLYTTFWSFAIVASFGSIITFSITPETRGKTLEEIQGIQNPEMMKKLKADRRECQIVTNCLESP